MSARRTGDGAAEKRAGDGRPRESGQAARADGGAQKDAACADQCGVGHAAASRAEAGEVRGAHLRRAWRLELLTVGWNVVEGVVGVGAALASGSVALLGFGLDSFVESASGGVLLWRLRAERAGMPEEEAERLDRRAHRLVGITLALLAAWVTFDAARALLVGDDPAPSLVGIVLTSLSLAVMWWLARAKRSAARDLGSRALDADAFQTEACWILSLLALVGVSLNAALGWWWADPVAALLFVPVIGKEALGAWRGEECCG